MATATGISGEFTLKAAGTTTPVAFRLVKIDSSGYSAYPNASVDDDVLATVGFTTDNPGVDAYQPVAGFGNGTRKVTIAASQTVAKGNLLYCTGTTGCVQTGTDGWCVGVAREAATSGASDLAIIEAVVRQPMYIAAAT
jgi:hypothetical protein